MNTTSPRSDLSNYEEALNIFRYRLDELGKDNKEEALSILKYLENLPMIDPSDGPLGHINVSSLSPNMQEIVTKVNHTSKQLLNVDVDQSVANSKQIEQDLKSIFTHFSEGFEPPFEPHTTSKPKRRTSDADLNIAPEEACPLIKQKLRDPAKELSINDSINLLTTCIRYGEAQAQKVKGKEAIFIIGNTGAGKSTFVNYLYGCKMESKKVRDLIGVNPADFILNTIVRVSPDSEKKEMMKIGHSNKSQTFMPEIAVDDQGFTYCDCPGFLDNRGAEINIANAVNIRNTLDSAESIKVIILINYKSIEADRGRGFREMLRIASDLFGSKENLLKYKESLLLGVTQIPRRHPDNDPDPLDDLRDKIKQTDMKAFDKAALEELSNCLFIYDPMDRKDLEYEGTLVREEILEKIKALKPIKESEKIFQTVLGADDEKQIQIIVKEMRKQIEDSIEKKNFEKGASLLRRLHSISAIGNRLIDTLIRDTEKEVQRHFTTAMDAFTYASTKEKFDEADQILEDLEKALDAFGEDLFLIKDLDKRATEYRRMKALRQEEKTIETLRKTFKTHCESQEFAQAEDILKKLEEIPKNFIKKHFDLETLQEELKQSIEAKDIRQSQDTIKKLGINTEYFIENGESLEVTAEKLKELIQIEACKNRLQIKKLEVEFEKQCKKNEAPQAKETLEKLRHLKSKNIKHFESTYQNVEKLYDTQMKKSIKKTEKEFRESLEKGELNKAEQALDKIKTLDIQASKREEFETDLEKAKKIKNDVQENIELFNRHSHPKNLEKGKELLDQLETLLNSQEDKLENFVKTLKDDIKLEEIKARYEKEITKRELKKDLYLRCENSPFEAKETLEKLKRTDTKHIKAFQAYYEASVREKVGEMAFGKAKWEKYFGDIGVEPPLPKDIVEILNSNCIFWTGQKVRDTHLLVLIPEKVNGKAFHLDSLSELIKSPKSGHKTKYNYYDDYVKKELGTQSQGSHWVLMTKDVIPDSRNKKYDDQKALVQMHAQSSQIPYELPKALEAATAILMHHVETGERLCSDDPWTYTRCQEKVNNNQWPAAIGGFSSGGLRVSNYRWDDSTSTACVGSGSSRLLSLGR
jgi:hypothetical protein